ncbi:glycosyltransferase [Pseudoalteromonas sp. JW3]
MPTHNRLKSPKRAVRSVGPQCYDNWELIIINDGSSDGTVEYHELLQSSKNRVFHNSSAKAHATLETLQ